jgi:hypothetical protein
LFSGIVEDEASAVFDEVFCITDKSYGLEFAMSNAKQILFDFTLGFARKIEELTIKNKR